MDRSDTRRRFNQRHERVVGYHAGRPLFLLVNGHPNGEIRCRAKVGDLGCEYARMPGSVAA